jgi:hypothetical protein
MSSDHNSVEVPHDVDWRTAYGRRQTQDFGFPGTYVKPRGAVRSYRPLEDPSNWIKRACGHFSYMRDSEGRVYATHQGCRQCSKKALPFDSNTLRRQRTRKSASTESSVSSSYVWDATNIRCERKSKHRERHPKHIPADRCGDALATELGFMIDIILEEHSNSLRDITKNIEHTRPGLAHLRSISERLFQCCEADGIYLLKAAEKLNVGSPGQLKPTLHDTRSSLREVVQTIPDLIDLVNSAADNFGINLDRRPTAHDDLIFQNAPVASTHKVSVSSEYADSMHDIEKTFADEQQLNGDPWLHQTRK